MGSMPARGSPWLFAACHVLHRLWRQGIHQMPLLSSPPASTAFPPSLLRPVDLCAQRPPNCRQQGIKASMPYPLFADRAQCRKTKRRQRHAERRPKRLTWVKARRCPRDGQPSSPPRCQQHPSDHRAPAGARWSMEGPGPRFERRPAPPQAKVHFLPAQHQGAWRRRKAWWAWADSEPDLRIRRMRSNQLSYRPGSQTGPRARQTPTAAGRSWSLRSIGLVHRTKGRADGDNKDRPDGPRSPLKTVPKMER